MADKPALKGLLTVEEVASLLKIHRHTLSRREAAGKFPARVPGAAPAVRYRQTDVEAFVAGEWRPRHAR